LFFSFFLPSDSCSLEREDRKKLTIVYQKVDIGLGLIAQLKKALAFFYLLSLFFRTGLVNQLLQKNLSLKVLSMIWNLQIVC
jgi:hypothetical protein